MAGELCELFEDAHPSIILTKEVTNLADTEGGQVPNGTKKKYAMLTVTAKQISGPKAKTNLSRDSLSRLSVHIIFHLRDGWQMATVTKKDIEMAVTATNCFIIYRSDK